jgi:hypothetical protein
MTGRECALEGASLLRELFPDRTTWPSVAERLHLRSQKLLYRPDTQSVGFFLFGMSEAARGARGYGN